MNKVCKHRVYPVQASSKSYDVISLSSDVERCNIIDLNYIKRSLLKVKNVIAST